VNKERKAMAKSKSMEAISNLARPADCGPDWHVYELDCSDDAAPSGWIRVSGCDASGYDEHGEAVFDGYPNNRIVFIELAKYRAALESVAA
jgi:hypothetical protein